MKPVRLPVDTSSEALHLISSADLADRSISSTSKWNSSTWQLDNQTNGSHLTTSRVNWRIPLGDGSFLTDPTHHKLLDWIRRVVWGLLNEPGDGRPPLSPGSMGKVSSGLSYVAPWLAQNGIEYPHQITTEVLDTFLAELPSILAPILFCEEESSDNDSEGSDISLSAATSSVMIFYYIWRQRDSLSRAGIQPMPNQPWPEHKGAFNLGREVSKKVSGWINPLPDEVAVPLLNNLMRFIGIPAEDILQLRDSCDAAYNRPSGSYRTGPGDAPCQRVKRQKLAACAFQFRRVPGENSDWHQPIEDEPSSSDGTSPMRVVRQLVIDLMAACCLVIQSMTGMRVSELCGLKYGINPATNLPINVEMRLSATGLNEEFILVGELSKGYVSPIEVPWLIGSRRCGDKELPLAVRAIIIINAIMRPYRHLIDSDNLLLSIKCPGGLPKSTTGLGRMTGFRVLMMYRAFMSHFVDLSGIPDESHRATSRNDLLGWKRSSGQLITTHQLRKTYAQYVLSTNASLLPAVKRQFHHLNMSITESGYWGQSSNQIEPIQSVSRQLTSRILFDVINGNSHLGGKMGALIQKNQSELADSVRGLPRATAWIKIGNWLEENEIQANHSPHGVCIPISAGRMECWKKAGKQPSGSLLPNFDTRDASLCAGCRCFAMHESHIPFWKERYVELEISRRTMPDTHSLSGEFREIHRRRNLAKNLLKSVGVETSDLEADIFSRMQDK